MRKRHRVAALENAVRSVIGGPQLASATPTAETVHIEPAVETDVAMPIRAHKTGRIRPAREPDTAVPVTVRMGPVVVRSGATLDVKVIRADGTVEVTVPDTPERQAAAFSVVATAIMVSGWLADVATYETGYVILGAAAGWWGSARLWNRRLAKS
jgi:hypothetical protein